ncbi:MAG: endo alpha-1,4 polygalactosaminidase [Myxococcales bacterium]|nr:endo alpha-1,4 polygalactosaminidase [Myxococcales bacterium]
MRLAIASLGLAGLFCGTALTGCDDGKKHLHPEAGRDAPPPKWWRPELGTAKDWDIQLAAPYDVSATRTMYDLDLWALVPAPTMIDYGDGDPVSVPAGALAGKAAELRGRGVKVICHVDTGAIHLTDPDARKFPGFSTAPSPPDRPTAPAAGSVIGWSIDDAHLDERFLDIRTASRTLWTAKMWKRLDLAKQIGCDGVDGDRNDSISSDPGFTFTVADQNSWYAELVSQLHMRELSAGMRNGHTLPGQVDMFADDFDWMVVERCGEFADCDQTRPFINLRRVVFAIDYEHDIDGALNPPALVCGLQRQAQVSEGLIKDDAVTSALRTQCTP